MDPQVRWICDYPDLFTISISHSGLRTFVTTRYSYWSKSVQYSNLERLLSCNRNISLLPQDHKWDQHRVSARLVKESSVLRPLLVATVACCKLCSIRSFVALSNHAELTGGLNLDELVAAARNRTEQKKGRRSKRKARMQSTHDIMGEERTQQYPCP